MLVPMTMVDMDVMIRSLSLPLSRGADEELCAPIDVVRNVTT